MNQTVKTAVISAGFVLAGIGIYNGGASVYNRLFPWTPDATTTPLTFSTQGEKPQGILQLTPAGALTLNLPELFKAWQLSVEAEKKAQAAQAKAGKTAPVEKKDGTAPATK